MAKKMISPDWKKLRSLPGYLQRAWFYIWDKSDACGVYHFDEDYLKLDLKLEERITLADLARLPECKILPGERVLIQNFLSVNYGHLRADYNPHKAAYRDIEKNGLILNSSLNNASLKLVDTDVDVEEDKDTDVDEEVFTGGDEKFLVPKMCEVWYKSFPKYTANKKMDQEHMGKILGFIWNQAGENPMDKPVDQEKTLNTLQLIADQVNREPFWINKPIKSIASNIQEFYNKIKNPINGKDHTGESAGKSIRSDVQAELDKRRATRQQTGVKSGAEGV
jgi:hypothetical protein